MKFKKTLILFVIISVLASLFAVTSFADASNGLFATGDVYTFNDVINGEYTGYIEAPFHCFVDNIEYTFAMAEVAKTGDNVRINYYNSVYPNGFIVVYENGNWLNEGYRTIIFDAPYDVMSIPAGSLSVVYFNGYDGTIRTPVYISFRDIIVNYIFGGNVPSTEAELAVNLVCLVASLLVAFVPLLVILWLCRWVTTLGRSVI